MMGGHIFLDINRPFASCPKPLFHNEAKCEAIDMKILFFILMQIKLIFALGLVLKARALLCMSLLCSWLRNRRNDKTNPVF